MERLTRKRAVIRAAVTRTIHELEDILNANGPPGTPSGELEERLEERYQILLLKEKALIEINKEIEDVVDDKNLVEELEGVNHYEVSVSCMKTRVVRFRSRSQLTSDSATTSTVTQQIERLRNNASHVKLPRLEIGKYGGDPKRWTTFWDQFRESIHNNDQLSKIEKFQYFKSYLVGKAEEAISGLSVADANYDVALELVKERFGQKDLIINEHLTQLLNLKEVPSSNNVGELRGLYDKVNVHVRSLEALGVKQEAYAVLLHTALQKQQKQLKREVQRAFISFSPL